MGIGINYFPAYLVLTARGVARFVLWIKWLDDCGFNWNWVMNVRTLLSKNSHANYDQERLAGRLARCSQSHWLTGRRRMNNNSRRDSQVKAAKYKRKTAEFTLDHYSWNHCSIKFGTFNVFLLSTYRKINILSSTSINLYYKIWFWFDSQRERFDLDALLI